MSKKANRKDFKALEAALSDSGISLENLRTDVARQATGLALFKAPDGNNLGGPWIRDIVCPDHEEGETWCAIVSAPNGKTYEVDFTIANGAVAITGEPSEVIAQVEYEPANETAASEVAELETRSASAAGGASAIVLEVPQGEPLVARGSVPFDYAEAPKTFMWMPSGTHFINCGFGAKDWSGFVACLPGDEKIVNAALEAHKAAGRKPFTDFDHQKLDASSWPKRFLWQDSPEPGIYEEPEWTQPGLEAVTGKKYRGFSPGFFVDAVHGKRALTARAKTSEKDPARLIGTPLVMGGLTNIPAFAEMAPLWARQAETPATPSSAASAADRAAGAQTSEHNNNNSTEIIMTKPTVEELQQRNTQLEAKIQELTAKQDAVSQAELRAVRAERDSNMATITVTEANNRIAQFEARETARKESAADVAVETMVTNGVIPSMDKELKASYRAKFIADPELIPLLVGQKSPLVARQTPGAAAAGVNGNRLIHGERKVKAITVLKEAAGLMARARSIRGSSAMLTPELCARKSEVSHEMHALYANDISANNDILNMTMHQLSQIALEAAAGEDTLGTLSGTLVIQRTLEFFRLNYPLFKSIFTDFSDQPALLGQTMNTRIISTLAVQTYNKTLAASGYPLGWDTASPATSTDVNITNDEHVGVPVVFGADAMMKTIRRLFDENSPAMAYALAEYFVAKIYGLCTAANYNGYVAVTAPDAKGRVRIPVAYATYAKAAIDFGRNAAVDLNAIFNPNLVPIHDRVLLLNSEYYAAAGKDSSLITFWAGQRDPELVSEGELPRMSKFTPIEAPDFPATNNRVGIALQKNGMVAASRIPVDYTKVLPGASYGTSTMITDPETGMSVMLVEYVNHDGGYAVRRMETVIGAGVGDKRGGLVITKQ